MHTMRRYNLNIGYNICFESMEDGPELRPSERFHNSICSETQSDVLIRIHSGEKLLSDTAKMVFEAPLVEEINGDYISRQTDFWSIWKDKSGLFIKTIFPQSTTEKKALLKFSITSGEWDLWIESSDREVDPMEYPLDGLILYYLSVKHGDIFIHASGVNNLGHGYLFSGVSGKGKSTMANIWENTGSKVIHDDRLIIRKTRDGYTMYSTPVYKDDEPRSSQINKIFLIEHGVKNKAINVSGAAAVSLVMANCIQHNWNSEIIARLLGSISIMCKKISVVKLAFRPDRNIIDYILENE